MHTSFTIRPFTRDGTNLLKGIGIILIALHNFYRWIEPITGENEFNFSKLCAIKSWIYIRSNPLEILQVFFNFLGHYGVQAFIVISAYGLTLSWQQRKPKYGPYILHRFDKLWPPLFFAALVFLLFQILTGSRQFGPQTMKDLGIQLTLFANLVPGKAMTISGPWWFYSFIFQCYLVFPLLIWVWSKLDWKGLAGMVILGYVLTILLYDPLVSVNLNIYMMFIGHLPELCLGIFLASRKEVKIPWWVILIALVVAAGGNWYRWMWPFANLGVAVLLIVAVQWMLRVWNPQSMVFKVIVFIGIVSMYIFALQGFVRNPFLGLAGVTQTPFTALVSGLLFLATATGLGWLMLSTENGVRSWIGKAPRMRTKIIRILILAIVAIGPFAIVIPVINANAAAGKEAKAKAVVFAKQNDFETPDPKYQGRSATSTYYHGKQGFLMPAPESFSPAIEADLDKIDLKGVDEADASVMLFMNDSLSSCHLVIEVIDRPSGKRLSWNSRFLEKKTFTTNQWFLFQYTYNIPPEYRFSNFIIKTFVWNPNGPGFTIDDLRLVVRAKR